MLSELPNILIMVGSFILVASLFPVRQFIARLPAGELKRDWIFQTCLIIFFVFGYVSYIILNKNKGIATPDLLVPVIFLFGSFYVKLVTRLSLKTAWDMKKLTIQEHENITDTLTGIYNRRYFNTRISEEFARALRYQQHLSILVLDIDHFKSINGKYGRQTGDMVLKELAEMICHLVRNVDVVARYGGEEIVVVAPNTELENGLRLADRLRLKIQDHRFCQTFEDDADAPIQLTMSIGIAACNKYNITADKLMKSADMALLRAKGSGRNCVVACRNEQCKEAQRPRFGERIKKKYPPVGEPGKERAHA